MTNCTECGSDNVERIDEGRFKCLDCSHYFTQEEIDEIQEFRDEEGDARKVEGERERQENSDKDTDWDEEEDQTGDGVGDPDDADIVFM
jgi:transcription initiation factor TFIIIB Brf1 subunit/transcription initiation factor TFIIB